MKDKILFLLLLAVWGLHPCLQAQEETECNPLSGLPVASGELLFNYGSTANAFNTTTKTSVVYGQPLVGQAVAQEYISDYGVWSLLLMPPQAPVVRASQGDFPDRVLLNWKVDPLGAKPTDGFIILRDDAYLTNVEPGVSQFIDFNVQAGEFYEYKVVGKNAFGEGVPGISIGFVNPNGVVSGKIETSNGNPVPNATVTLTPTYGNSLEFDGISDNVCVSYKSVLPTDMFTVSTWMKIGDTHDSDGVIDLGSDLNKNFWIKTTPAGMGNGVVVGVGDGTASEITHEFVDDPTTSGIDESDDWNHVAAVYGAGSLILYVNGEFIGAIQAPISNEAALYSIGSLRDQTGFFDGKLDDIRIYNRLLTQTEIISNKNITVSKITEGLVAYWKFDEGVGSKVFDLSNSGMHGTLNGTDFTDDTPDIKNGGMTDATGFYFIEGINYSSGQSFTARPEKLFYNNYSLEFNAAYEACATFTNFDLTDTAHIELTVHPFDLNNKQTILSKMEGSTDAFDLFVENGKYKLTINGETQELGDAASEYQHLALSMNTTTDEVIYYLDGDLVATFSYGNVGGVWDDEEWQIGAKGLTAATDFYTGLIDEVAFYADTMLTLPDIQLNAAAGGNGGTDIGHPSLAYYFDLNEGEGTDVYDSGPSLSGEGTVKNATYSFITLRQEESPHEFEPNSRFVNINNSNTAISGVDFKDISTVPVSGVIRFENTFCYQDSVEILVNGVSYFPPIFTNGDGRFVADFEPGASPTLTPKFGRPDMPHDYFPAFYEVRRLNSPVANVLFQNKTKREVVGQVTGGLCRKSIITTNASGVPTTTVKVKLAALNGCYEEVIQLGDNTGKFTFENVPPIPVAVSVIEHSNNDIYNYFQVQGGVEIDLREIEIDTADFIYIAPPNVELGEINSGLLDNDCNLPLIFDSQKFSTPKLYSNDIRVYQDYVGGKCYLDSFDLIVENGIAEYDQESFSSDSTIFVYEWYANNPNLLAPHTKNLQVVGQVGSQSATASYQAIVLGERQQESTISTSGPSEVFAVLHDPPGDASFATLETGTKNCTTWEQAHAHSGSATNDVALKLGQKKSLVTGTGIASITTFEASNTTTLTGSFEASGTKESSGEFCFELTKEISTSDGDDIWGDYADVYYGAAINYEIGARDVLDYDFDNCQFFNDQVLTISPTGFATDFVFTRWQIETEIIPQLDDIIAQGEGPGITYQQWDAAIKSKIKWEQTIDHQERLKKAANYGRNVTFDAAATYTETATTELTESSSFTSTIGLGGGIQNEHGWEWDGFGVDWTVNIGYSYENTSSNSVEETNTVTTSFTFADDDLNDFYSVSIADNYPELPPTDLDEINNAFQAILQGVGDLLGDPTSIPDINFSYSMPNLPFSNTPMFRLEGGESMCPWIPGTRNREEVFAQIEEPVAINVSSNTAAIYNATFGNIGPNGVDGLVYQLGVQGDGNPDGAEISIDGSELVGLNAVVPFQFVGAESINKQIAVEIGTSDEFIFDTLGLYFGSQCQIEHSLSVGYDPADENGGFLIYQDAAEPGQDLYRRFYRQFDLTAHFVEPCTKIDISFPLQNHTVTPGNENLFVTLSEYDEEDDDLDIVRVQYRPISGDGSWINILELEPEDLTDVFTIIQWDMIDLKDGTYELRAVADCAGTIGGNLTPGISEVVRVIKETEAPKLFGAPEPADGVLSAGDEISISFNEIVNCNKVFDADGIGTNINLNNIALINTETGTLVPFSHQCLDNKIIISPEVQSVYINGNVLKAVATEVEDLAGNKMEVPVGAPGSPVVNFKEWEFLVDLNPLRWEGGSDIKEVILIGSELTLTRNITNMSGAPMDYTITGPQVTYTDGSSGYDNIPTWMNVFPLSGTLEPGEIRPITFVFPKELVQADYLSEINVVGSQGNKSIEVDVRVMCEGPEWEVDPSAFTYSMNFTLELDIQGVTSTDDQDVVGAFVDGELRGKAYVEYEPFLETYLAFLTVYSNEFIDSTIEFQIWDSDQCQLFGEVMETFPYAADEVFGLPDEPIVLHTNGLLLRDIPLLPGWNWISFNLGLPDPDLDSVLASLAHPEEDLIKNQTAFANFYSGNGWIGSLNDLNNTSMFQYQADVEDTISMVGNPIDIDMVDIPLVAGWNWIGYVPQIPMPVDSALASLSPLNGDVVKSQTAFAQYVAGYGWLGNLDFMQAPKGYLLRVAQGGTLNYPDDFNGDDELEKTTDEVVYKSPWVVQPANFEHSMILVGMIEKDGQNVTQEGQSIGVFANEEVRGVAQSMYIEHLDQWMFFLTIYANQSGEPLNFKLYDAFTEETTDLDEAMSFAIDDQKGTVEEPTPFVIGDVLNSTEEELADKGLFVQPNPFKQHVQVRFYAPKAGEAVVTLTDAIGRVVKTDELDTITGWNGLDWNTIGLAPGMYIVKVETGGRTMTRKVVAN